MFIVQLFIYTKPYLNHMLRVYGFQWAINPKLRSSILDRKTNFEKHCKTKVVQKNVLTTMHKKTVGGLGKEF